MKILVTISTRILQLAVLTLAITSATFLFSTLLPGDFFSAQELDPTTRRQTVDLMRHRYGMDQSVSVQYGRWLARIAHLDFGESRSYQQPVRDIVIDALLKTLWIGLPALLFGLVGGVLLGTFHALHRDKPFGLVLDLLSSVAMALPTLILGLGAVLIAATTGLFPVGGMTSASLPDTSFITWCTDRLKHLILPVLCLTVPILVYIERIQCAAAQGLADEAYVRAARARGLTEGRVFFHYLLRPSLNPILSTAGPLYAGILSGSLVLEVIFAWPGLGQVTLNALLNRDTALVVGCVAGSTVLLVLSNLAADLLLMILDPRTRIGEGAL